MKHHCATAIAGSTAISIRARQSGHVLALPAFDIK
jgi:hypothetical protein